MNMSVRAIAVILGIMFVFWGCSSVGRATGSQSVGREFDPPQLHQLKRKRRDKVPFFFVLNNDRDRTTDRREGAGG